MKRKICPHTFASQEAVLAIRTLAADLGAMPVVMPPQEHDRSVALVSHVPQVIASLMASELRTASPIALELAGQGLRDVTRIAASDPTLWVQILAANHAHVAEILTGMQANLANVVDSLANLDAHDVSKKLAGIATLASTIADGNDGYAKIPGKHGATRDRYDNLLVLVPDKPGQLGRLFAELGEDNINIEDFSLEHSPNQPVGIARISVTAGLRSTVETALDQRGWTVAG